MRTPPPKPAGSQKKATLSPTVLDVHLIDIPHTGESGQCKLWHCWKYFHLQAWLSQPNIYDKITGQTSYLAVAAINIFLFSCSPLSQMLLEVIIYVPKLDPSLFFPLDFLYYSNYWLWEFIFQEKVNSCTSNQILHLALPVEATGTYSRVLNWNLWNYWNLSPGTRTKPQFLPWAPM